MKIVYKHGDLLQATETFIVHGCNAQGSMGSGVARLLRDSDENIYAVYRRVYEEQGLDLGQVIPVRSGSHVVLNAITQEFYGKKKGHVYVDYDAVRLAMRRVNNLVTAWKDDDLSMVNREAIAMPLIGAGLAQGKWSILSQIIEEECTDVRPVVYLIDGVLPDDRNVPAGVAD